MNHSAALKLATKMTPKARNAWAFHTAILVRAGNIIGVATNHSETHAEVAVLNSVWPSERRGTKLYSIRVTRGGKYSMAKPCPDCERYMRESGVKTVFYTNRHGNIEKVRL